MFALEDNSDMILLCIVHCIIIAINVDERKKEHGSEKVAQWKMSTKKTIAINKFDYLYKFLEHAK